MTAETRAGAQLAPGAGGAGQPRAVAEAAVREELERILASSEFRTSQRCKAFLRYVVENTLAGRADQLKERTIGIDVFERQADYDPSGDATVRVKAGEVRKRLLLYYSGHGRADEVHIELPAGKYIPEFRSANTVTVPETAAPAPAKETRRAVAAPRTPTTWRAAPIAATAVIVISVTALFASKAFHHTAVERFWAPVLERSKTPVTLSTAYVPVYAGNKAGSSDKPERIEDFTLLTDQFVGGGDLLAVSNLARMLDRMHRDYDVKIGTESSFSDLRNSPTVIVGYSYTRWKEISKELRFFIDADRRPLMVTDNGKPTRWALPELPPDKRTNEDYAIVSRVFHPDTQNMLVEIAGITQYGTAAAADLVTKPQLLEAALRDAPPDWEKKNLQLVLHTKVISGVAAGQKVVATYFW